MSTEKMREDFEKFRDERNATPEIEGHKPGSKWHVTNAHYQTWKASRAAIEVELPAPEFADGISQHRMLDVKDTIKAIESIGLKVKS